MATPSASVADERVAELWATLDTRKQGHLDLPALKKGLRKLDHRMHRRIGLHTYLLRRRSPEKCRSPPGRRDEGSRLGRERAHIL
jgi:hypothetical protein